MVRSVRKTTAALTIAFSLSRKILCGSCLDSVLVHSGTKQHAQESYPSQQGTSADWSWTARAHRDIIGMQHMFSVYVHCPPDFTYAPGNLFAGYEVPGRVPVTWGQWSVVSHDLSPRQVLGMWLPTWHSRATLQGALLFLLDSLDACKPCM